MKENTSAPPQVTFQGQTRTLFKRHKHASAPWYMRVQSTGGDEWINLQTANALDARRRALDHLKDRVEKDGVPKKPAKRYTIGQILKALEEAPVSASAATRRDYGYAMKNILERVYGREIDWTGHPVSVLDGRLVSRYREIILREAQGKDDRVLAARQRTANSNIRQARSLFSREAMTHYKLGLGWQLPDVSDFLKAPTFRGARKTNYQPASDALIRQTFTTLEAIKSERPSWYIACWLAVGLGLRKGEIAAARKGWFKRIEGRWHLEIQATTEKYGKESPVTKNGQVNPCVPVTNGAWERLEPLLKDLGPDDYLIAGSAGYRCNQVFREVNQWLRTMGWVTEKGIHELRAYGGCQVVQRDGIMAASQWLRHGSVVVTQQHYGRYIKAAVQDKGLDLWDQEEAAPGPLFSSDFPATSPATSPLRESRVEGSKRLLPSAALFGGCGITQLAGFEGVVNVNIS